MGVCKQGALCNDGAKINMPESNRRVAQFDSRYRKVLRRIPSTIFQ
jgi:hypothetical protein